MSQQLQDAYIVAATRTPIGKAPRGMFRHTRPDDLLVRAMQSAVAQVPGLDAGDLDDLMLGCAEPNHEQGTNMARVVAVLLGHDGLPGTTVNRFCASSVPLAGLDGVQRHAGGLQRGGAVAGDRGAGQVVHAHEYADDAAHVVPRR